MREREHFSRGIMVSVSVSRMKKTSVVIVEPGAKMNGGYYNCEHFLRRAFLPDIQALCGHHNWKLTSERNTISHSWNDITYTNGIHTRGK